MKLIFKIPFLIFCFNIQLFSQTKQIVNTWENATKEETILAFEKASNWFVKTSNYEVQVVYASFINHTSTVPHDKFEGYYKRSNNNFSSYAMGIHIMQNDKIKLVVDTANQIIILNSVSVISQNPVDVNSFSTLLENVKSIKKYKTEKGEQGFKIEFNKGSNYQSYEFSVNEKGLFKSVKYFYSVELALDDEDEKSLKGKPRVEIVFNNYQTDVKFNIENEFSEKKYLKEENKKIILNTSYKNFELKDYRTIVKNK